MFAVCVKPSFRNKICSKGLVWVKDSKCPYYVSNKDRGVFETKEDAEYAITEIWEIIVEV